MCVCVIFWRGWNRTHSNNVFTIWLDLSLIIFHDQESKSEWSYGNGAIKRMMTPLKLICTSSFRDLFSNSMLVGNHVWTARNTASFLLLLGSIDLFRSWGWSSRRVFFPIFLGVDVKWQQAARDYKCVGGMLFPAFCFSYWSRELGILRVFQWFWNWLGKGRHVWPWQKQKTSKGTNILKPCKHGQIWRNWWLLCLVLGHFNVDLSGTQTPFEKKVLCQVESKLPQNWLIDCFWAFLIDPQKKRQLDQATLICKEAVLVCSGIP